MTFKQCKIVKAIVFHLHPNLHQSRLAGLVPSAHVISMFYKTQQIHLFLYSLSQII